MKIHRLYVRGIAGLIWGLEYLFFYPALRRFYHARATQLPPNPVIWDVGSNRGQSLSFFAGIFPGAQFTAFEPNPRLVKKLVKIKQPVFTLKKLAVSDRRGNQIFFERVLDETSGLAPVSDDNLHDRLKNQVLLSGRNAGILAQYEVATDTIDDQCADGHTTYLDILKIDVEGHEQQVLAGAREMLGRKAIGLIQLEMHEGDRYPNNLLMVKKILADHGYLEVFRKRHAFGKFYEAVYAAKRL
jgi:FkbM family methyltransferase